MRNSKLIFSAAIAVAAMLGIRAASAADLPARTYTKAPAMVAEVYDWTGFYIGGDVGWGESHSTAYTSGLPSPGFGAPAIVGAGDPGIGVLPLSESLTKDSFIGGVYAGYNWQVNRWVVGVEGDATFLNGTATNAQTVLATFAAPFIPQGPFQISSHTDWLATIRGRVGYTWDRLMVYGTGGAAWTQTSYTTTFTPAPVLGTTIVDNGSFNQNKVGFAVGGGLEWMVTRNWLLRAEYLYYRFDASSGNLPVVGAGTCTPATCSFGSSSGALEFQTVRVGVSYKFGGPVVAKY